MLNWAERVMRFLRFPIFGKLVAGVIIVALYSLATMHFEIAWFGHDIEFPAGIHTLFTLVLSILLVMRTNTSYDRWWEGRRLWGQLVQAQRHLAQIIASSDLPAADKDEAHRLQATFGHALVEHLRAEGPPCENRPLAVTHSLYKLLGGWRQSGQIEMLHWQSMERHLSIFQDVCGGCERIRRTPPPLSHRACVPQILVVYLLLLPWGMPNNLATVAVVSLVGYFTISIELIAEELQDPFGLEPDDLPLERLASTIASNLGQVYG